MILRIFVLTLLIDWLNFFSEKNKEGAFHDCLTEANEKHVLLLFGCVYFEGFNFCMCMSSGLILLLMCVMIE